MKRVNKVLIWVAVLVGGGSTWFFSRDRIDVIEDAPVWASEFDAAYQRGQHVPAVPVDQMKMGERLRVLWVADGKDYRAAYVMRPGFRVGWVLLWDYGLIPASS